MTRLLNRLLRSSTQRVMSLNAAGMALALLADVLIVRRFGFGAVTDALVIALTLPRLIGTIGRDATKFSLMTIFIRVDKEQGPDAFADLGARVFNLFAFIGLLLLLAGLALATPVVRIIGPGLAAADQALAATLLRLASGIALFALGSAVLEVMLNSRKHFTVTALRNAVTPCVVIAVILATWRYQRAAYAVAAAFTGGYACYFLLLLFNAAARLRFRPTLTRLPGRSTFAQLRGTIGYPLAGFGVRQAARIAERAIASMGPTGSVAAFYFAYRLLAALQNIVGVSVALTGQPKLTEHDLDGDRRKFLHALRRRIGCVLAISLPAAALLMLLSNRIIHLLYGHSGMDPAGLRASASVLFILGPAVVFYCLTPVLNSALYAQKRFGAVLCNMCLAAGSNVILAYGLFCWLGLDGVAWAATIAAVISVANLSVLVYRSPRR